MYSVDGIVSFIHRWQWLVAAIVAGVPTLFYGPRKALETWDWYVNRFRDEPLLQIMRDRKMLPRELDTPLEQQIGPSPPMTSNALIIKEGSYSVGDLANILRRSRRSIGKSVKRLRAQGKIELHRGGFRLRQ